MLKTKNEIQAWLDSNNIKDYNIREDLTIDVNRVVKLDTKKIIRLPVKFNQINGDFNIYANELITLEGCPNVVIGSFAVNGNKINSLIYSPDYVSGNYHCGFNEIKNLFELKTQIGGTFYCDNNPIENLDDLKTDINKNVYFYKENDINFRLTGYEEFYDEKGFLNIPFSEVKKIQLRNNLNESLKETKKISKVKI